MADRKYRSACKAFTWRVVGTIDTMLVSYFVTGEILLAVSIGGVEVLTKMVLFYFHERTWDKLSLGKQTVMENTHGGGI